VLVNIWKHTDLLSSGWTSFVCGALLLLVLTKITGPDSLSSSILIVELIPLKLKDDNSEKHFVDRDLRTKLPRLGMATVLV
jgi:hypothetical protein